MGVSRLFDDGPAPARRYCLMILTSSIPASTRLPVDASAASINIVTVCPAKAFRLTLVEAHAPFTFTAAPSLWKTVVFVAPLKTLTRKKSALEALLP